MRSTKIYFFLSMMVFTLGSFAIADAEYLTTNQITTMSNNSCKLSVSTEYGSPARSVKVGTDVSGGVSCMGGKTFFTDSSGEVRLEWSSGCYLRKIFIEGKGYDVDFKNGNSYNITMK